MRSPTPQDRAERTLYSWVAMPQARRSPIRAGKPSHAGVTISGIADSMSPLRARSV